VPQLRLVRLSNIHALNQQVLMALPLLEEWFWWQVSLGWARSGFSSIAGTTTSESNRMLCNDATKGERERERKKKKRKIKITPALLTLVKQPCS
jgi:hypothetical protein